MVLYGELSKILVKFSHLDLSLLGNPQQVIHVLNYFFAKWNMSCGNHISAGETTKL